MCIDIMSDYVTDSGRVDGSWELTIEVTDVQVEKKLRVNGDLHIGGVMVKLVEALGRCSCTPCTVCTVEGKMVSRIPCHIDIFFYPFQWIFFSL